MSSYIGQGKLSATKVKQAKPAQKTYKLSDGLGLNLEVRPSGSKYWRLAYRYQNKQKTLALGVFPVVTLAEARERTIDAKKLLAQDKDPNIHKKQKKASSGSNIFEVVAREWHKKEAGHWSKDHASRVLKSLEMDAFPHLADIPVKDIKTPDVLYVIRKIEDRGALDVAGRVKQRISSIFRYAIQTGVAEFNSADQLKDVIKRRKTQHRKSILQDELPRFLKALDSYEGYILTRYALQLILYTFVRPGEIRSAEWVDFDLENAIWRIPARKTKMKEEYTVPLSKQAVELLVRIQEISGEYDLVFPGVRNHKSLMSENTLTYAIRKRLRFDATAHGFRTTASTILNEEGYRSEVIERQLAHGERDKVRAAYNRSQHMNERIGMMQWYSDHLDSLKS